MLLSLRLSHSYRVATKVSTSTLMCTVSRAANRSGLLWGSYLPRYWLGLKLTSVGQLEVNPSHYSNFPGRRVVGLVSHSALITEWDDDVRGARGWAVLPLSLHLVILLVTSYDLVGYDCCCDFEPQQRRYSNYTVVIKKKIVTFKKANGRFEPKRSVYSHILLQDKSK